MWVKTSDDLKGVQVKDAGWKISTRTWIGLFLLQTEKPIICTVSQNASQADCELGNPFKRDSEVRGRFTPPRSALLWWLWRAFASIIRWRFTSSWAPWTCLWIQRRSTLTCSSKRRPCRLMLSFGLGTKKHIIKQITLIFQDKCARKPQPS